MSGDVVKDISYDKYFSITKLSEKLVYADYI